MKHVMLKCKKYDRLEIMHMIMTKMKWDMNLVIKMTEREWMMLLLGHSGEASE